MLSGALASGKGAAEISGSGGSCYGSFMKMSLLAVAALTVVGAPAAAQPAAARAEVEARIPFLHIGRVRTFRATDQDTVYIQAQRRQWYRVTTMGPCPNLPWARVIGVDTHGGSTLDRSSTLLVDGDRCPIQSVVRSGEPPRRERRRRS